MPGLDIDMVRTPDPVELPSAFLGVPANLVELHTLNINKFIYSAKYWEELFPEFPGENFRPIRPIRPIRPQAFSRMARASIFGFA